MSGYFLLDWLALAFSLFVTIILAWLGLTVLINAENRSWGVGLAVGGLVAGAVFFASHSIILSLGAWALLEDLNFWWHVAWLPLMASPFAWYLLMLWYNGYWDRPNSPLYRRQRVWLGFCSLFTVVLSVLLMLANPLPDLARTSYAETGSQLTRGTIPLIILAYPPYIVLCIGLSFDAVLHPAPSQRLLGDLARRRARPWLAAASLVLLVVSLLVGAAIFWLVEYARQTGPLAEMVTTLSFTLSMLDLVQVFLITLAVLFLGQAIVSYEIFTGKTLPRRGFRTQWRTVLVLAAVLGSLGAWTIFIRLPQIYTILVLVVFSALTYAYFGWQGYTQRQESLHSLRQFITSPRLYESILTPGAEDSPDLGMDAPFSALCQDVLGVRSAALVPLGWLAALRSEPLRYPPGSSAPLPDLTQVLARLTSPQMVGLPLDLDATGFLWTAPLWSERGLVGVLVLGEKTGGGLYSEEEIEMARASGERLADLWASTEMARRLVALQRQRLVESSVMDHRARRVLHDEVLPQLHTALLQLSSLPSDVRETEALAQLAAVHHQISNLLRDLPAAPAPQVGRLGLPGALRQVIEHELQGAFNAVTWQISPEAEGEARRLPPLVAEVMFFAAREVLRNAAHHGRRPDPAIPLRLEIQLHVQDGLQIEIKDNGPGYASVPGFYSNGGKTSPAFAQSAPPGALTAGRGSGQGLALHTTLMAVIGGSLMIDSLPGQFTRVVLSLPRTAWASQA